jgi:hypothetical protein
MEVIDAAAAAAEPAERGDGTRCTGSTRDDLGRSNPDPHGCPNADGDVRGRRVGDSLSEPTDSSARPGKSDTRRWLMVAGVISQDICCPSPPPTPPLLHHVTSGQTGTAKEKANVQ